MNIGLLQKKYVVVIFLILFSSLQFFLLIRHKNPFISDSYFYEHVYYTYQGMDFNEAFTKIRSEINFDQSDEITKSIFSNEDLYRNSLSFFDKRPLYPFLSYLSSFVYKNNYINMLMPAFMGFIGTVLVPFLLIKKEKGLFFAAFGSSLLLAFYPFLDWSTYFLTDTIGSFLWLLQLYVFYQYLTSSSKLYFLVSLFIYGIALFNREQGILMLPVFVIFLTLAFIFKYPKAKKKAIFNQVLGVLIISILFIILSTILGHKTLLDTFAYNQTNYGLSNTTVNSSTTLNFWINSLIDFHTKLIDDLFSRHFTVIFICLALLTGSYKLIKKKLTVFDQLIFSSTVAAYLFVFVFPIFSYRYYFLTIIGVIYFFVMFIFEFFKLKEE